LFDLLIVFSYNIASTGLVVVMGESWWLAVAAEEELKMGLC
jgi:hypothetical protein